MYILGLIGLTLIITKGSVFDRVRNWLSIKSKVIGNFLNCSQCVGFWIGFLYNIFLQKEGFLDSFLVGCSISFLSYLFQVIIDKLE